MKVGLVGLVFVVGLLAPGGASAACGGTAEGGDDCDLDGVTLDGRDCDDADPEVYPGASEICGDEVDNDCDGLIDSDCTEVPGDTTLTGGGLCAPKPAPVAAALLPLALLWRRRRR